MKAKKVSKHKNETMLKMSSTITRTNTLVLKFPECISCTDLRLLLLTSFWCISEASSRSVSVSPSAIDRFVRHYLTGQTTSLSTFSLCTRTHVLHAYTNRPTEHNRALEPSSTGDLTSSKSLSALVSRNYARNWILSASQAFSYRRKHVKYIELWLFQKLPESG